MNRRSAPLLASALLFSGGSPLLTGKARAAVPIVSSPGAVPVERTAARELAQGLGALWPKVTFPATAQLPADGPCVLLGWGLQATPILTPRLDYFRLCGVILEPVLPANQSKGGRPSSRRRNQRLHALPIAPHSTGDPNSRGTSQPNLADGQIASNTQTTHLPCPTRSIVVIS